MLRKLLAVLIPPLVMILMGSSAQAIGVYADIPVQFKFTKDCTQDCSYSPTGLKVGVLLPSDIGLGLESYTIHSNADTIKFDLFDVSYLLPIPIVNITVGGGFGHVNYNSGGQDYTGNATQFWFSAGFPIIPLFDLHIGFHKVDSSIHDNATTLRFNGNMISAGALFRF